MDHRGRRMIKQDNRPQTEKSFEQRFNLLKSLLNDNEDSDPTKKETKPAQEKDKITFISINGNNTVVSTEKAAPSLRSNILKTSFFTILFFVCSFFYPQFYS